MKVLKIIMYIIELIGLVLFLIINRMANTNITVMHHALDKNQMIASNRFMGTAVFIMLVIFFILAVMNMMLISRKRYKCVHDIYFSVIILVAAAAAVKCFNVKNLFTYYYFIIAMAAVLVCETIKILINIKYKKS